MNDMYAGLGPEQRAKLEAEDERAKTPEGRYGFGKKVEYKVRPVTRYIVTKFERDIEPPGCGSSGGASQMIGSEYGTYEVAYAVAYALCKEHHDRLGYPPFDERVRYPEADLNEIGAAMENAQTGDIFA